MKIRVKALYGFRNIGVRHTPLNKLCGFFKMPPSMTKMHMIVYLNR